MELDILAVPVEIDFAPDNLVKEIAQNVQTILTTIKYSVPLNRKFGLDAAMLDRPMPRARAALQAEIVTAIRKYEPRCKVLKIDFIGDLDGKMTAKVRIKIDEERIISGTA